MNRTIVVILLTILMGCDRPEGQKGLNDQPLEGVVSKAIQIEGKHYSTIPELKQEFGERLDFHAEIGPNRIDFKINPGTLLIVDLGENQLIEDHFFTHPTFPVIHGTKKQAHSEKEALR